MLARQCTYEGRLPAAARKHVLATAQQLATAQRLLEEAEEDEGLPGGSIAAACGAEVPDGLPTLKQNRPMVTELGGACAHVTELRDDTKARAHSAS